MINAISKVTLYVNNQEEAKAFWTEKVGFEVRSEEQMGPDMKWIEVGPAQGDTTVFVLYDKKMMEAQNPKVNVGHPSVMMSTDNIEEAYKELLEKGVSVGTFSKTFSLAGLRLGWVAAPEELIERINRRRDYNTISCGKIDDYLAALAIHSREALLRRNLKIVADNAAVLDAWVQSEPRISYVRPKAGTTAFLKYDAPVDSVTFCKQLLETTGVMLLPGAAMDMEGWLRIGYCFAEDTTALRKGLALVSEFLRTFD